MRGGACLTSVCVQGVLKGVTYGQARRVVDTTSFGYRDLLRRLLRAVEHVAESQEKNGGTPQGCSRGGDGVTKNFTISELGDRPDHFLMKGSLPLR
jgi:hypothetical protein